MTRICTFEVTTTHPSGRKIGLKFDFECGSDIYADALKAFVKRSRKPWLYYGCEASITYPGGLRANMMLDWPPPQ